MLEYLCCSNRKIIKIQFKKIEIKEKEIQKST